MKIVRGLIIVFIFLIAFGNLQAQQKHERKGEFYFSWGYNTEWYTNSNVHINQPDLGNKYTFRDIQGHDRRGWDEDFFKKNFSIPQYNYRFGYFFNKEKGLAFEINFDHTKFIFTDGQMAHIKGTIGGKAIDSSVLFADTNGFHYYLNNGANFLLFNIVKRWNIYHSKKSQQFKLDFLGKAGIGPVIPHVDNSLFGEANDPGFQLGGWNIGAEGSLRATFFKYAYLEFCNKLDYARYSHLKIYKGTASQAFATYELILNLGITFPMGKREK